jgi:hypothetical protein
MPENYANASIPDGKYVAEVSLDGFCGGAAVPFTTYVEVRSTRFRFFGDQHFP